jgi:ABC-type transporter Mla MlaB component
VFVPEEVPARPAGISHPSPQDGTALFAVEGAITPDDIPVLCERLRGLMGRPGVTTVVCDMQRLEAADGVAIEALARLQLAARRRGCRVVLRNASTDLLGLLVLAGLSEAMPLEPGSSDL